jgi:hypothetical protein
MGPGRAGDAALGLAAVRYAAAVALAGLVLLGGCTSVSEISATVAGGVTGAATGSPAVGFLVGVATDVAANYVVRYYGRLTAGAEQDAIAQLAGEVPVGDAASWRINHTIPIGDQHGELRVVDVIDSRLATCRDVVFSVDTGKGARLKQAWYTTTICRDTKGWKWAMAEPAVPRWGYLQ